MNGRLHQKEESIRTSQILNEQYREKCVVLEHELNQKMFDIESLQRTLTIREQELDTNVI